MIRLASGTTMSRLSHRGNPAFAKITQNGTMISAAKTRNMSGPNGHIASIRPIISGMTSPRFGSDTFGAPGLERVPAADVVSRSQILRCESGPQEAKRYRAGKESGEAQRHVVEADVDECVDAAAEHEHPGQGDLRAVEFAGHQHERAGDVEKERKLQKIHVR